MVDDNTAAASREFQKRVIGPLAPFQGGIATVEIVEDYDLVRSKSLRPGAAEFVITSYSIHYTKLYDTPA